MTKKNKNAFKVIPLGGLNEVGKNMTAIEYDEKIFIVDAGVMFPDEDMYGVDVVIPDFEYLKKNRTKIKAMLVTHGHEDHIGAMAYFIKDFPEVPIYATKLTAGMIQNKLKFHKLQNTTIQFINPEETIIEFGKIKVSFFRTIHSIFDSIGIVLETPMGNIVHTGDYKIDYAPIDGKKMDLQRVAKIGDQGVILLISDSTNAEKEGMSMSEADVAKHLEREIYQSTGLTVVSSFASSLPRVQSVFKIAKNLNKKILILGKSMEKNIKLAKGLDYLDIDEKIMITTKQFEDMDRSKVLILATGAQGELLAALNRLSSDNYENVKLESGDTVIFSSGVIPGNEKQIGSLINNLLRKEVKVVQKKEIHTTGHGYQEEIKLMLSLLQPKFIMPAHGEYRMLVKQRDIAKGLGFPIENVFICDNGDVLEITPDGGQIVEKLDNNPVLVDNSGLGDVNFNVMRDRKRMAEQGMMVVQVKHFKKTNETKVKFELRGVVAKVNKDDLTNELKDAFVARIKNVDREKSLNRMLIDDFSGIVHKHIKRRPLVIPLIDFI
jgi:ribonuclease J